MVRADLIPLERQIEKLTASIDRLGTEMRAARACGAVTDGAPWRRTETMVCELPKGHAGEHQAQHFVWFDAAAEKR